MRNYGGLIVAVAVAVARRNGPTFAFERAARMHPSALVPAAGPATETLCTLPFEPNTIVAREGASKSSTQALAAPR
jgi:hypothetical protein